MISVELTLAEIENIVTKHYEKLGKVAQLRTRAINHDWDEVPVRISMDLEIEEET